MNRILIALLLITFFAGNVFSQEAKTKPSDSVKVSSNPEGKSPIKSLTPDEYIGYKTGSGMGLARVAELNNYPGPLRVLELQKELKLSSLQKSQLKTVVDAMKFKVLEMGGFILLQEKKMNELFASGKADEGSIIYFTNKLGLYQAELRNAHLQAHLKTRRILTPDQVKKYNKIKGY